MATTFKRQQGVKLIDDFTQDWIIQNALKIISRYASGQLTIRAMHYQLVNIGMTNSMRHYKRVVSAMEVARWSGVIPFQTFSDLDRSMLGSTRADETDVPGAVSQAIEAIDNWMNIYYKNRWENQPIYPELFIEKKALQNVFQDVCSTNSVGLGAVKGYPSLTFLHETAQRLRWQERRNGKECVILYFGDYDPSGEDIPRSIEENLRKMKCSVEVRRFALFESQVVEWELPPAPVKEGDSRTAAWDGLGQVELDAVAPEKLQELAQEAINSVFDYDLYEKLEEQEETERVEYKEALKNYFKDLD